ncbi:MAG: polysaccharide biosynthesis C-terminal domain-containing protein, partial [Clostridia bacterium]|nr:polysaccharide biosynthesis C-terminal domain-containing protein [Clostridia bacterium]
GAVSGAGIFGAQFFGSGDTEGLRQTFRFKIIMGAVITAVAGLLFFFWGDSFISLFLMGEGDPEVARVAAQSAHNYLHIMILSLFPFALLQCWASTLRETGRSALPMVAGLVAMGVNLGLNYVLIFGRLGLPQLDERGAAIATVISRVAEFSIVAIGTWITRGKGPFIVGTFRRFCIKASIVRKVLSKGIPLMLNEMLWASALAVLNGYYSTRGLDVVAANNINTTFFNVFSVAFFSFSVSAGIVLGQMLGAGQTKEAKKASYKLLLLSLGVSVAVGGTYAAIAGVVPQFYNTTPDVRAIATGLMLICALGMPFESLVNTEYFIIRSGGQAFITFVFDSGFMWVLCVPTVMLLADLTDLSIFWLYGAVQILNVLKCLIGFLFLKSGRWAKNIVS